MMVWRVQSCLLGRTIRVCICWLPDIRTMARLQLVWAVQWCTVVLFFNLRQRFCYHQARKLYIVLVVVAEQHVVYDLGKKLGMRCPDFGRSVRLHMCRRTSTSLVEQLHSKLLAHGTMAGCSSGTIGRRSKLHSPVASLRRQYPKSVRQLFPH